MSSPENSGSAPRLEVDPDVLFRRVEDEVVLVKVVSNEIFALNPTGARIWELLVDGGDVEAVVVTLCDEYGEPERDVRAQVEAFVSQLRDEGFLLAQ